MSHESACLKSLGRTSAAEWQSNSGQPTQQPGDPNGPFTIIAASTSGKGKILALDNTFYDDYFNLYPQNAALLSSALDWLTTDQYGSPPHGMGSLQFITNTANAASFAGGISPGAWISV